MIGSKHGAIELNPILIKLAEYYGNIESLIILKIFLIVVLILVLKKAKGLNRVFQKFLLPIYTCALIYYGYVVFANYGLTVVGEGKIKYG